MRRTVFLISACAAFAAVGAETGSFEANGCRASRSCVSRPCRTSVPCVCPTSSWSDRRTDRTSPPRWRRWTTAGRSPSSPIRAARDGGGYLLVFRELNESASFAFDPTPYVGPVTAAETIGGRGTAEIRDGRVAVTVPGKLDFAWFRLH